MIKTGEQARVLVTFPAYNEEGRISKAVKRIASANELSAYDVDILVAEDGSTDGTIREAMDAARLFSNVRVVHHEKKLGRGLALRNAWQREDADIYLFMDADLSTNLASLAPLVQQVVDGVDIATGSRYLPDSSTRRPALRRTWSVIYNLLLRMIFQDGITDHQCGFKAFSRKAVDKLLPLTKEDSWFWDTEVIVKAKHLGYRVKEMPVDWNENKAPRTNVGRLLHDTWIHGIGILRLSNDVRKLGVTTSRSKVGSSN